jgi:hypothetical protein
MDTAFAKNAYKILAQTAASSHSPTDSKRMPKCCISPCKDRPNISRGK